MASHMSAHTECGTDMLRDVSGLLWSYYQLIGAQKPSLRLEIEGLGYSLSVLNDGIGFGQRLVGGDTVTYAVYELRIWRCV
ncbi:hypothetical protein Bphy_7675 (plasmid) [Paraburkholderia phymatum STM815]|uniref:Uncharacterized protein n=3 Tax=Burkholderiaceae TaxID=119060 RepID=B2JY70_PARP8|nr:hypothetical protein Bphy_7675 [Paraburkholderia phymatum STM815]